MGRDLAAKFAFMAACFHFLSTPQVKQELSGDFLPKHSVHMRKSRLQECKTLSLFVSFEYDRLSEECGRKADKVCGKFSYIGAKCQDY